MSLEIRFTTHAQEQLQKITTNDRQYALAKLNHMMEGQFSKIAIYLQSAPLKDAENTFVMRLGRSISVVYSEESDSTGNTIYLIQTIYKTI